METRPLGIKKYETETDGERKRRELLLVLGGAFIGFVNGFFGAGGGMLAVPLLVFAAGLNEKQAHATAIAVILPLSLISGIIYSLNGAMNTTVFTPVLLGTVLGGIIGAILLSKLNNKLLAIIFYGVMLAAGIKLII